MWLGVLVCVRQWTCKTYAKCLAVGLGGLVCAVRQCPSAALSHRTDALQ
jgi:hypothetical protein